MKSYNNIRMLEHRDAIYILEWMQSNKVVQWFKTDFSNMDLDDVLYFIDHSHTDENQHFAIVDDMDEYLGTISLKNISYINKNAEYSIVIRESAQHQGFAQKATKAIIEYAFHELGLQKIQLNVLEDNKAAICFYEKFGFIYEGTFVGQWYIRGQFHNVKWYAYYNKGNVFTENL